MRQLASKISIEADSHANVMVIFSETFILCEYKQLAKSKFNITTHSGNLVCHEWSFYLAHFFKLTCREAGTSGGKTSFAYFTDAVQQGELQ